MQNHEHIPKKNFTIKFCFKQAELCCPQSTTSSIMVIPYSLAAYVAADLDSANNWLWVDFYVLVD
jgi:hypothetical protein